MPTDEDRLRALLDVGRALVTELDPEAVLERILQEGRRITGANFAALGVLDRTRSELERFVTSGLDEEHRRAIGNLPRGRGVLGVLIEQPQPLRLSDVSEHPRSYGFPPGHPAMHSFLGVPIMIRGQAWGNLYLAEKQGGGPFTEADEESAVILGEWAATAIENARLYDTSERRRSEAERAVRSLEAARDIADMVGSITELEPILELVVKRGRALVDARSVVIMLREGEELVVAASAGHVEQSRGIRLPIAGSTSGRVLLQGHAERISDAATSLMIAPSLLGIPDAHTALLVPMLHHGTGIGVLAAFDRGASGERFTPTDEQLLRTFAASAANAVAIKRSVEADRLRAAIAAADAERSRWARELHDQTLQALGGLRVLLASSLRRGGAAAHEQAIRQAIEDIELEVDNLRGIITDLRPSLLDDLGLLPAIESLIERRRDGGLEVDADLRLPEPRAAGPLTPELETTIYRLVQEALTNVVKHAHARRCAVSLRLEERSVIVEIRDDGSGFDPESRTSGFGLPGMRERVYLAGGTLEVSSGAAGTTVRACIPATPGVAAALPEQAAR
jgi:signal transduction histidine kinase